jgi:regulator of PEP synthase PpsR (kinase-PPPase family)
LTVSISPEADLPKKEASTIFVVSDGRGDTCDQFVRAALVQFEGQKYSMVRKAEVRTAKQIKSIVKSAAKSHAIIFYTLVSDETRKAIEETAKELLVPAVDVLGPAFSALHDLFKSAPQSTPGLLYSSDKEYFDRIVAIDYTLKHDDGQRPHELKHADVVLVGVSRASKSSTCFYLAYQGIRAANIPLVPELPPLPQLLRLDPAKVIGLRINVMRLMTVREARAANLRLGQADKYTDKREIAQEVLAANRTMDEHGWRSIDVSYKAIEEIAREVMLMCGLKGGGSRWDSR